MQISPSTAKTYVSRLYEKLGATNRAQALMMAFRSGLIQFDQDFPVRRSAALPHDTVEVAIA